LLAGDEEEASDLVEEYLAKQPAALVFDEILIPALVVAQRNRNRGDITADMHQSIIQVTREVVDDIPIEAIRDNQEESESGDAVLVFGCPARIATSLGGV
jgi:hypothetical protein